LRADSEGKAAYKSAYKGTLSKLFIYLFFYPRECDNQYIKYVLEYTQTHIP